MCDVIGLATKTDSAFGRKGRNPCFWVRGPTRKRVQTAGRNLEKPGMKAQDTSNVSFSMTSEYRPTTCSGRKVRGVPRRIMTNCRRKAAGRWGPFAPRTVRETVIEMDVEYICRAQAFCQSLADFKHAGSYSSPIFGPVRLPRASTPPSASIILKAKLDPVDSALAKCNFGAALRERCKCLHIWGWGLHVWIPICVSFLRAPTREC